MHFMCEYFSVKMMAFSLLVNCLFMWYLFCGQLMNIYWFQGLSRSPKDGSYYKRIPKSSAIKVIDFGSTTYEKKDQTYIVSTRHYRAPEVILGKNL